MNIKSAQFIRGIVGEDRLLEEKKPQIAFIGRSNVGKSTIINTMTGQKSMARTSSFPGRTQQINIFLINGTHYFMDLPGYGFARVSGAGKEKIFKLINWYLFNSPYIQKKIIFIIDARIGMTRDDLDILKSLQEHQKNFVVLANKIDKVKNSEIKSRIDQLQRIIGNKKIILFSATKKKGVSELTQEIFG